MMIDACEVEIPGGKRDEYRLPPPELINYEPIPESVRAARAAEMQRLRAVLVDTFAAFHVEVTPGRIKCGPDVTRYEFTLSDEKDMRIVTQLETEIMAATQNPRVNIVTSIPGKVSFGIDLANSEREDVNLRELLLSPNFADPLLCLPVALGRDVVGEPVIGDIADMGHLLIGSVIGMGKSVCVNNILLSLLYKFSPAELGLVLIDLKNVEMNVYRKLPHLAAPIVTSTSNAIMHLKAVIQEVERRFSLFECEGVTSVGEYNRRVYELSQTARANGGAASLLVRDGRQIDDLSGIPRRLPHIVVVINELADLMLQAKGEAEFLLSSLAMKAPSVGIHLVATTQMPQKMVVTETIKRAFPSRIALKVTDKQESRVMLDDEGAETLMEHGDGLLRMEIEKGMTRFRAAIISFEEISRIVEFCSRQRVLRIARLNATD